MPVISDDSVPLGVPWTPASPNAMTPVPAYVPDEAAAVPGAARAASPHTETSATSPTVVRRTRGGTAFADGALRCVETAWRLPRGGLERDVRPPAVSTDNLSDGSRRT